MRLRTGLTVAAVAALALAAAAWSRVAPRLAGAARAERPRAIEIVETLRVPPPDGAKSIQLWIPKPPSVETQTAELLSVEAPVPYRLTSESEFNNETVYLETKAPWRGGSPAGAPGERPTIDGAKGTSARPIEVTLRYRIVRRAQAGRAGAPPGPAELAPRGLLAVNDEIREIARRQTHGLSSPLEKGRALYDFVLKRMAYDKSGAGWGRGDSIYACRIGKGNCTDFHSLFMALAIASGIPARFQMGFSLPDAPEGVVAGYHCWAEFYAEGTGWVPVDISEAWKNLRRKDYYFGRLDAHRVLVSTGREIRLSPPQRGRRLNFLSRPYAEADGRPVGGLEFSRRYQEIPQA